MDWFHDRIIRGTANYKLPQGWRWLAMLLRCLVRPIRLHNRIGGTLQPPLKCARLAGVFMTHADAPVLPVFEKKPT